MLSIISLVTKYHRLVIVVFFIYTELHHLYISFLVSKKLNQFCLLFIYNRYNIKLKYYNTYKLKIRRQAISKAFTICMNLKRRKKKRYNLSDLAEKLPAWRNK